MDTILTAAQIWENIWACIFADNHHSCPSPHSYHCSFQKWPISTTPSDFSVQRCSVCGILLSRVIVVGAHRYSLATTSLFALIVIILSGLVTNFSDSFLGGFFNFAALGIATGLLTLLTLPAMFVASSIFFSRDFLTLNEPRLALSMVRKGAFTSMIALEIGWTC